MTRYVLQRLLWLPFLLLIISLITFLLGQYGPGDPIQYRLGTRSNQEAADRLRAELGLDRPVSEQWLEYVTNAAQGNFGESISLFPGREVGSLIGTKLGVSLQLNLAALVIGGIVGVPIGIIAAFKRNSFLDYVLMAGVVGLYALPAFLAGPVLVWIFAAKLKWISLGWDGLLSAKAILPVLILSLGPMAVFARQTRANLSEVLDADYIRTARGKGLDEFAVLGVHAMRNALIPLLTIFGLMLGGLVGGSFITEQLFGIPGVGQLGVQAFYARDYPIIMALTLLVAVVYAVTNLLVDIFYAVIDPRIRVS